VPTPSLGPLLFKNAVLMGIQPASDSARLPGRNAAAMEQMLGWFRDGLLRPKITEVYPLERAGEALQQLKDRRAKGRIVLVMT
jgi:NADPH2:quinone reductase